MTKACFFRNDGDSHQQSPPSYLLCSFLQDKLRRGQAQDGGIQNRSGWQVRESHSFDEGCSGAGVSHTQTHFADTIDSDVCQRRNVAVALLPLVLQDDVARSAVARQRNLIIKM